MVLQGWDMAQPPKPFGERAALTREAIGHRHDHTLLPQTGIAEIARALRRPVEPQAFEHALAKLPPGAREFWAVQGVAPLVIPGRPQAEPGTHDRVSAARGSRPREGRGWRLIVGSGFSLREPRNDRGHSLSRTYPRPSPRP
ncbi:MAG: hypothetical protein EPO59_11495 [Bosea sp. (in: a-proteobacteria)]|nr:hypothetical protein [Bosea sp. (in: a-proteobacteria)]TAJ30657.1 MAG: hypothetical protein EPO59_11495 [Bosea sp. (in: a-proteobacteria)]